MHQHLRLGIRLAFFACLAVVMFLALDAHPLNTGALGDKSQHFVAFLVLAGLCRLGWPSMAWGNALALVAIGGIIELMQGTTFVGRDMSFFDWLADSAGVVCGSLAAGAAMRLSPRLSLSSPPRGR